VTDFVSRSFPAPTSWENRSGAKYPYLMPYHVSTPRIKPNVAIYMCLFISSFLLVSCGSDPDMADGSATRTPAEIFSNYQPPAEDEVFEFIGIADLTIEEIKALLGEPEPKGVPGGMKGSVVIASLRSK